MANPQTVIVSWTPNTEADLLEYVIRWGFKTNGVISYFGSFQVTPAQFAAAGNTWTIIPANMVAAAFPTDGVYWFTAQAYDTSGNGSNFSTPQSKRIIKTASKLKRRK